VYGGSRGPDLDSLAAIHGLTPRQVVEQHSAAEYRVYMMGFMAGFPYLGGLPPRLATPRLSNPRLRVPAGSVAIGGEQTGIYPQVSPGGWQIIGYTPFQLFDKTRDPPSLLGPGDRVRFIPVREEDLPGEA
jgi:KipI family sensor histidine kinase inhibitor